MLAEAIRISIGPKIQESPIIKPFFTGQDIKLRNSKHSFLVKAVLPSQLVLDCGCGDGTFTNSIKNSLNAVIALDLCRTDLIAYEEKIGKDKASLVIASIDALPVRTNIFDLILLLDCLEHSENPGKNFKQVFDSLRPNGRVIMTAPNWYNRYLDLGQIGHQHFLSSKDWLNLIKKARIKIIKSTCLGFPVFDLEYLRDKLNILGFWVAIIGEKESGRLSK